jgi:hypothetical protein
MLELPEKLAIGEHCSFLLLNVKKTILDIKKQKNLKSLKALV